MDITATDSDLEAQLSLPELVYRKVKNAIVNGLFLPGQMLRQEELAVRLGVSRNPLREALPRLEAEGVVVLHPRRGYAVAALDETEIVEVFELRVLLECSLARKAVARRNDADIAAVYTVLHAMARLESQRDAADRGQWFDLNVRFHETLLAPAGAPHHARALQNSRTLLDSYIRTEVNLTGDLTQAQQEHSQLAAAFAAGQADVLETLLRQHSEHTRDRLLEGLRRAPSSTAISEGTPSP